MINAEFLSRCSDEQISKGVAWIEAGKLSVYGRYSWTTRLMTNPPAYCTNPNDIMPIAFANGIFVIPCIDGKYMASNGVYDLAIDEIVDECNWSLKTNPLRAICEVYILMSVNK